MVRILTSIALLSLLTGCGWVAANVADNVAGVPISDVATDVKSTSDEYRDEKKQERVQELSDDYEEFLRSKETPGEPGDDEQKSILVVPKDNEYDQ